MIEHYLAQFSDYVQTHPGIGLLATFLIAFAESLPLIGTIIPGSVTMTVIGILVGRNIMSLPLTLFLASFGAFIGDIIGFGVGKYYKERLRNMWPFKKRPHWLEMGKNFFKKHGGKSILIGRFVGPARSSIPLFAGLLNMRWAKFLVAAIPSAVLWALLYIVPGIILGTISLAIPKEKATTFTLIGLGIIILLWLIFWAIQRFFVYLALKVNTVIDRSWNWLNRHHASQPVIRLITNQQRPQDHYQLMRVCLAIVFFIIFLFIYISVILHAGIQHLNKPLFHLIQTLRDEPWDKVFVLITEFGDKYMIGVASAFIALFFLLRRDWYTFWHVVGVTLVTFACVGFFKNIYYSPRPTGFMIVAKSSSLPSGHSTICTAILGFYSFLIARHIPKKYHWIPYLTVTLLTIAVVFSRLYLGAHWICDVLAGMSLGLGILLLAATSYRRKEPRNLQLNSIWGVLAILFICWGAFAASFYKHNFYRYTPIYPEETVNEQAWWNNPTKFTPLYRLNRFGHPVEPFNVQWAGNASKIKAFLISHGWKDEHNEKTLKAALSRFATKSPEQHIAFLNELYRQKPPAIFLIKLLPGNKKLIEFRLWKTGIALNDEANTPLYIGSIHYHKAAKAYFTFHPHLQLTLKDGGGTAELIQTIQSHFQSKTIKAPITTVPVRLRYLDWDKSILLIKHQSTNP